MNGKHWRMRLCVLALVGGMAAGGPGGAWAGTAAPSGDGLMPHIGEWQKQGDEWRTIGQEPPGGWYLRAQDQYDLKSLSFAVRKEQANGYIWLYTDDWRILLKPDCIHVTYAACINEMRGNWRYWPWFHNTFARPIAFPSGKWCDFKLVLDGEFIRVFWNGQEVVKWNSPEAEWGERMRSCKRLVLAEEYRFPDRLPEHALAGIDQIVVLHAYETKADFKGILIDGRDKGLAQGFHTPDNLMKADWRYDDSVITNIVPIEPVNVTWSLEGDAVQKASKLPAVSGWEIPWNTPSNTNARAILGERGALTWDGVDRGLKITVPEYFVGAAAPGPFPEKLWGPRGKPREVQIYFNNKEPGVYTLVNDGFRLGTGPTPFEISVNGRPVSRIVYRPAGKARLTDYVPLKLDKGPYCITLRFLTDHVRSFHGMMKEQELIFGRFALVAGPQYPVQAYAAPLQDKEVFKKDEEITGEQYGKTICWKITGLETGRTYTVKPLFYEVEVSQPGARLMDIFINDELVEKNLDILKTAGCFVQFERSYPAAARALDKEKGGVILFRAVGKNNKAFLNALTIEDDKGARVFYKTWAWSPARQKEIYSDNRVNEPVSAEPPKWKPDELFDGHNLIPNPHFSLKDERQKPSWWYSARELDELTRVSLVDTPSFNRAPPELQAEWKKDQYEQTALLYYKILPGNGEYAQDAEVGHTHPGSLKIGKTDKEFGLVCNWPCTDYGKQQEFSFWAKTDQAKGKVTAEIYWFIPNMFADHRDHVGGQGGAPMRTPILQLVGKSTTEANLTGTSDWKKITLRVKPPYGAAYAMPAIRVDENTAGTIWIDDAELDGYGAEPLEISYSLLGYHPKSGKALTVRSLTEAPVAWEVLDKDGKTVKSGAAKYHSYEWFSKRHYYTFNITDFEQPGVYRVRVKQGAASCETDPIKIDRDVYRELCRVALNGIHFSRYGCEVVGGHDPEVMDDAQAFVESNDRRYSDLEQRYEKKRRNALYGYYDAGDEYKKPQYWPGIVFGATAMYDLVKPALTNRTQDDALAEMLWGFKSYQTWLADNGAIPVALTPPRHTQTENIPLYGQDRCLEAKQIPSPQIAGVLAMGAYLTRTTDKEWSKRALELAIRNYNYNFDDETQKQRAGKTNLSAQLTVVGKALLAEIYLHALTGEQVYKDRMEKNVKILAAALQAKAYRCVLPPGKDKDGKVLKAEDEVKWGTVYQLVCNGNMGFAQDFLTAPCHFVRMNPKHPLANDMKQAFREFAADVARVSGCSPWGQAHDLAAPETEVPKRWPSCSGYQSIEGDWRLSYWPMLAYNLAQIGMILDDPEIVRLAERQLQWCLGNNVTDTSVIHGVGQRMLAGGTRMLSEYGFVDAWLKSDRRMFTFDGLVSKNAFRRLGNGAMGNIAKGDLHIPPLSGYPEGYHSYWLEAGYPGKPGTCEYYMCQLSPMALAAAGIQAAMQYLEQRGK